MSAEPYTIFDHMSNIYRFMARRIVPSSRRGKEDSSSPWARSNWSDAMRPIGQFGGHAELVVRHGVMGRNLAIGDIEQAG